MFAIFYAFSLLSGQLAKLGAISSVFDRIHSFTPYGGQHAFVTLDTGAGKLAKAIAVSIAFVVIMLVITYHVFKKSELK